MRDLTASSRLCSLSHGRLAYRVCLGGSLSAMQQLNRELPGLAALYCRTHGIWGVDRLSLIRTCLDRNAAALTSVTESIYEVSDFLSGKPPELAISNSLVRASHSRRLRRREKEAVRQLIDCIDGVISGKLSPKRSVILVDQAAEDWVKSLLPDPPGYFQPAVDMAEGKGLLTKREAASLRRHHRSRNRLQHRGNAIRRRTAVSILTDVARTMERRYKHLA